MEALRNALQHYFDTCRDEGFTVKFRGDVPSDYTAALTRRFQNLNLDSWGRPLEGSSGDELGIHSDDLDGDDDQGDSDFEPSVASDSGVDEEASGRSAQESHAESDDESRPGTTRESRDSQEDQDYSSDGSAASATSSRFSQRSKGFIPFREMNLSEFHTQNRPRRPPNLEDKELRQAESCVPWRWLIKSELKDILIGMSMIWWRG